MKKTIIINVGNKGAILSVKNKDKIVDQLYIDSFNQDTFSVVSDFFKKYQKLTVRMIVDTVAQNYNHKAFPNLNYFDLIRIVNRRFNSEIPKNDLKQKKFLYKDPKSKKSSYLFVSISSDSPIKEWLNFFKMIPNKLLGIYALPLETVEFARKILTSSGIKKFSCKNNNKWIIITFNNKVSDLRQVAIFNNNIAFTRLISLDSVNLNLAEFAKKDILRTTEYVRRFDPDFSFEKLIIINIFDKEKREILRELKIDKTIILNYTPEEIFNELKLGSDGISNEKGFSDLLLSMFILKNRKRVKFGDFRLKVVYAIMKLVNTTKKLIFSVVFLMVGFLLFYIFNTLIYNNKISELNEKIKSNRKILHNKSEDRFGMDSEEINNIIEIGSLKELIDSRYADPLVDFKNFRKVQGVGDLALTYKVRWFIKDFGYNSNDLKTIECHYKISLINPSGNVNKLFTKYDYLNTKLKDVYGNKITKITTLPNNINFGKSYLTYPLEVETTEKR